MFREAGLDDMLLRESDAQYTVFAPTNDAFDMMEQQTLQDLLANPERLKQVRAMYNIM